MKKFDVIGLGACGIDYITKVERFSDKNNKVTSDHIKLYEGGVTSNNLVQASRLGLRVMWCGALGNDDLAEHLIKKFNKDNIDVNAVRKDKTQFCWIIVDKNGDKQIYVFPNATGLVTTEIVEKKFMDAIKQCKNFHTEVAVVPLAAAIRGAEIAKNSKAKVFLDIDGDINYLLNKANIGTREELNRLIKLADVIKMSESAAKQVARIKELHKSAEIVAVTLGEEGCYIADKKETIKCPAYKIKCIDSTGAGDAFMGGLSYAVMKKMKLKQIGMFANACGAFCCTQIGARGSGDLKDITRVIKENRLF